MKRQHLADTNRTWSCQGFNRTVYRANKHPVTGLPGEVTGVLGVIRKLLINKLKGEYPVGAVMTLYCREMVPSDTPLH